MTSTVKQRLLISFVGLTLSAAVWAGVQSAKEAVTFQPESTVVDMLTGTNANTFITGSGLLDVGAATPTTITIGGWGHAPLATIHPDGTVEIGKGSTPNAAARLFWKAVEQNNPLRNEVTRLKRDLAVCRSAH